MTPEQQVELLRPRHGGDPPRGRVVGGCDWARARDVRSASSKGSIRPPPTSISATRSVCASSASSRTSGHQVVLIVGDYTGRVGDPSGRSKTRPQLSDDEVEANARTYLEQFYRVLDPNPAPPRLPVEVHRNGEWFSTMPFMDVMRLASQLHGRPPARARRFRQAHRRATADRRARAVLSAHAGLRLGRDPVRRRARRNRAEVQPARGPRAAGAARTAAADHPDGADAARPRRRAADEQDPSATTSA